jgi:transcriptional regulator with XRE-family HTH domain
METEVTPTFIQTTASFLKQARGTSKLSMDEIVLIGKVSKGTLSGIEKGSSINSENITSLIRALSIPSVYEKGIVALVAAHEKYYNPDVDYAEFHGKPIAELAEECRKRTASDGKESEAPEWFVATLEHPDFEFHLDEDEYEDEYLHRTILNAGLILMDTFEPEAIFAFEALYKWPYAEAKYRGAAAANLVALYNCFGKPDQALERIEFYDKGIP